MHTCVYTDIYIYIYIYMYTSWMRRSEAMGELFVVLSEFGMRCRRGMLKVPYSTMLQMPASVHPASGASPHSQPQARVVVGEVLGAASSEGIGILIWKTSPRKACVIYIYIYTYIYIYIYMYTHIMLLYIMHIYIYIYKLRSFLGHARDRHERQAARLLLELGRWPALTYINVDMYIYIYIYI